MSFERTANCTRSLQVGYGNGLSILATMAAPLFAVLLTQYLETRRDGAARCTLPLPHINLPEVESTCSPEVMVRKGPQRVTVRKPVIDPGESWDAFAPSAEKRARARNLIAAAKGEGSDPAGQFATLHRAKQVATEANDGQTAFQAIDALAETFPVDADAMKMSVLAKLASMAHRPAQHKSLAEHALEAEKHAASQNHLMIAHQLGKLAIAEARRALDDELLAKAQGGMGESAEQGRGR